MHGRFLWADLSTFDLDAAHAFYARMMGWRFDGYFAHKDDVSVAGLYTMPEKFQAIGMPSFWMSYIGVDNLAASIETASRLGGRVEVGPQPLGAGQFALVRDPLGAGFTLYEGDDMGPSAHGHALFVSAGAAVRSFYAALFEWTFGPGFGGIQAIQSNGMTIGHLHEIPDPVQRGTEQYWGVLFGSSDLIRDAQSIEGAGGEIVAETALPEGASLLARDPQGAAFFLVGT